MEVESVNKYLALRIYGNRHEQLLKEAAEFRLAAQLDQCRASPLLLARIVATSVAIGKAAWSWLRGVPRLLRSWLGVSPSNA